MATAGTNLGAFFPFNRDFQDSEKSNTYHNEIRQ
jgi:hypothetical protein